MSLQSFKDWLVALETNARSRARKQDALGLGPEISPAARNVPDTAPPWQQEIFDKRDKKKKHHKKEEN